MTANLEMLLERFNALTNREKMMSVGAFLLIVWGSWDNFFYQGIANQNQALENEINTFQSQIDTKLSLAKQLEVISHNNPNTNSHIQLTQLQQSVKNLEEQLSQGNKKFVPAASMAHALSDMLKQNGKLKLIKLETLPVTPFGKYENQTNVLYCHTLAITLQGDYFSTLNYLKSLEALPWRIQWDSIDFSVKEYPIAETRIQVYTLSFEKDWLGV